MPFINFRELHLCQHIYNQRNKKKSMFTGEFSCFAFNLCLRMDKATPLTEIKIQVCVRSETVKVLIPNPT